MSEGGNTPATAVGDDEFRKWLKARQLGADLERSLARAAPEPRDAIDLAFELMSLAEHFHGWPPPLDPVSVREEGEAREAWSRLRRAWSRGPRRHRRSSL